MKGGKDPALDQESLFHELVALRRFGVRRGLGKVRTPKLALAARALGNDSGEPVVDQIKAALDAAANHLGETDRLAVITLMDLGTLKQKKFVYQRREAVAAQLKVTTWHLKDELEKPMLERLAAQLIRLAKERASTGDPRSEPPTQEQTAVVVSSVHDEASKAHLPRQAALGMICLLLLATGAILFWLWPNSHSHITSSAKGTTRAVLSGDCSRTTAQLFDPYIKTRGLVASSQLYMSVPHQHTPATRDGWVKILEYGNPAAHIEAIHAAEVRQFALSYHNYTHQLARHMVAKVALPPGATLIQSSTCLYKHGEYKYGGRFTSGALVSSAGQPIGSYAPGASAYLTFSVLLPDVRHLTCGRSEVAIYGKAASENLEELNWGQNASVVVIEFEHRCH